MVCRGNACDNCTRNCRRLHHKEDSSPTIPGCLKETVGIDFSEFLHLPPGLASKLKHLDGRKTDVQDSLGNVWPVILAYVDKKLAFQEGWGRFYQDHGLKSGHRLEIQYIKGSDFVVRIFNTCGFEKLKFNQGRSRKRKRSEGNPEEVSKDEFVKTVVDDSCVIDRDGGCLQEENRNFLDLEKLERVKETAAAEPVEAVDAKMTAAAENADCATEQAEITGQDSEKQMNRDSGSSVADEMEKGLETYVVPLHAEINEKCERAMIDTNQVNGESEGILTGECENASEVNEDPAHADMNEQSEIKGIDSEMGKVDTNQMNGSSGEILPDEVVQVFEKDAVHFGAEADEWQFWEHEARLNELLEIKLDDSKMGEGEVDANQFNESSGEILTDEFVKGLETNVVPSHVEIKKQSEIKGNDSEIAKVVTNESDGNSFGIYADKFEKSCEMKAVPFHFGSTEQNKTMVVDAQIAKGNDSKIAKVATNEINGNSVGICTDKFEKSCEMKAAPFRFGSTEQNKTIVDDAQMVVNRIAALYRDTSTDDLHFEPSSILNSTKGINDAVSKLQNDGESPSIDGSETSRRQSAVKRNFSEFSFSRWMQDGKHCIKRERVELGEEVKAAIGFSGGMELPMLKKHAKIPPVVKVEPDLSCDDFYTSFSAEVKTLSYLELPMRIPSIRGKRDVIGQGKVIYLRDSMRRLWPVLCPDKFSVNAFTTNWANFCKQNNVNPGDECKFLREPEITHTYRVDVTRQFDSGK